MPLSPSGKCAMLKDFPVHGEQALGHSSCRSLVPGAGVRAVPKAAQHFTKGFGAALASSQSRLQREHFEILLEEENSTGSPPPEKV